jgi:hypothetical protein
MVSTQTLARPFRNGRAVVAIAGFGDLVTASRRTSGVHFHQPVALPFTILNDAMRFDAVMCGAPNEFHESNLPLEIECSHRATVPSGGFEPNTLSVESLGLQSGVPHRVRGSHRTAPFEGVPTLKRHLCLGKPHKPRGSPPRLRHVAPMALKTLPDCPEFYNAPNQIKGSNQTTNLGVRSSNLFGRAKFQ